MAVYNNRSQEKAERLVKLRDYLYDNASPTHAVTVKDILTHFANKGIEIEIKTVYSDLHTLRDFFGLDIEYNGRQRGYFLMNPPFSSYELRLIVNSIQAAQFITQEEADKLTTKMRRYADRYTRKLLDRKTFVVDRVRTINNDLMQKLDTVYEAIAQDKQISYQYEGNIRNSKNCIKIDGSSVITASPAGVIWTGASYLIFAIRKRNDKTHRYVLQLEKMKHLKILEEKREGISEAHDVYTSFQKAFDEREDKQWETKLKVKGAFTSEIAEKFGHEATITPLNSQYFIVTLNTYPTPELYMWTRKFNPPIKIIEPSDAEDELRGYFSDLANGDCTAPPYP